MYQRGSGTILFITLVVPVIFLVTGILASMMSLTQKKEDLRPDLEQSVLFGSKFLPDGTNACSLAQSQFSSRIQKRNLSIASTPSHEHLSFQCSTSKESIQAVITGLHYLAGVGFAKLFLPQNQQRSFSINYKVATKVRIQPTDTFIYFDSSSYMAPNITGPSYWGLSNQYNPNTGKADSTLTSRHQGYEVFLPVTQTFITQLGRGSGNQKILDGMKRATPFWTPSLYFRNTANLSPNIRSSLRTDNPFSQALQTQQCFNPVISPLKYAAIELYDSFTGSPINTATVVTNHHHDQRLITLKTLGTDTTPPQRSSTLDNLGTLNEVRDYDCLASSYVDYHGKTSPSFFNRAWQKGDFSYYAPPPYPHTFGGSSVADPPVIEYSSTGDLSSATRLRVRDAIWGKRVSTTSLSLELILRAAKEALFNSSSSVDSSLITLRAGLNSAVENRAYLILGDFPDLSHLKASLRTNEKLKEMVRRASPVINEMKSLAEAQRKKTYIFMIFTRREERYGNNTGCSGMLCEAWYDQFKVVEDALSDLEHNSEYLDLVPIRASDPSTVAYETTSALLRVGRTAILSTPE